MMALSKTQQERFNRWYEAYDYKKARGSAERAWAKINPDEELTNVMVLAIRMQDRERDWKHRASVFHPEKKYPATWLNSMCWEDEVQEEPNLKPAQPNRPESAGMRAIRAAQERYGQPNTTMVRDGDSRGSDPFAGSGAALLPER